MTTQTSETTDFEPIPLNELKWFEIAPDVPVFIGNTKDICQHIEAHGFKIYYVIATLKDSIKNGSTTITTYHPQVFKIVNNDIGRAVLEAKDDFNLDELQPAAWFGLPKIPHSLIKIMDDFFRHVYEMYSTESIVLLTYDQSKTGPNGWGLLIPDQENTGSACDYDPSSILEEKPDNVVIVGSAHSHPGMSAYASGTDHKDQASFDGIHITYGWQKSNNAGATEYHIELQFSGQHFPIKPDQVFGDMPTEEVSEEVKQWVADKVKKKYSSNNSKSTSTTYQGSGSTYNGHRPGGGQPPKFNITVPDDCPDVEKNVVIGELASQSEAKCPFCDTQLISQDLMKRRCLACHQYIVLPGENLDDLARIREEHKVYSHDLRSDNNQKSVYVWRRTLQGHEYEMWHDASGK